MARQAHSPEAEPRRLEPHPRPLGVPDFPPLALKAADHEAPLPGLALQYDTQHPAQRLCCAPQQLIPNRESRQVFGPHIQLA